MVALLGALILCAAWLDGWGEPSWTNLGSMTGDIRGGSTCWIDGTVPCPITSPQCEYRYGDACAEWPFYTCWVGLGSEIWELYPPQAKEVTAPGYEDSLPNPPPGAVYHCGWRWPCENVCELNEETERYECVTNHTGGAPEFVTSTLAGGDACTPTEE